MKTYFSYLCSKFTGMAFKLKKGSTERDTDTTFSASSYSRITGQEPTLAQKYKSQGINVSDFPNFQSSDTIITSGKQKSFGGAIVNLNRNIMNANIDPTKVTGGTYMIKEHGDGDQEVQQVVSKDKVGSLKAGFKMGRTSPR